MRILIVGLGSMGKRRIRLLSQLVPESEFICVDNNTVRLAQLEKEGYIVFNSLSNAISFHPDLAFVCTSPGHHAEIILQLIESHIHVFTELNLVSEKYDEIIEKSKEEKVKVFMSSSMLYDKQIISIGRELKNRNKLTYIYHVGQYLPNWHPWESYKDFFIGKKETNGCREILAIQLPWIIKLFGKVKDFSVIKKKNSSLDIDFNDMFIISMEHENGNSGVFVCDVIASNAVNYLEVMGEKIYIRWDGTPETLLFFNNDSEHMEVLKSYDSIEHVDGYANIINEDQYREEIKAFLDWIFENKIPLYSLNDDRYTLDLIDSIESDI